MFVHRTHVNPIERRGVAATELAVLLPLLVFIALVTVDFGRFAKCQITVNNAARNGALFGSGWDKYNPTSNQTDTAGIYNAAYSDIQNNLENVQPSDVAITSSSTTDAEGYSASKVVVTVKFRPLIAFAVPGLFTFSADPIPLSQSCTMRVRPRQ